MDFHLAVPCNSLALKKAERTKALYFIIRSGKKFVSLTCGDLAKISVRRIIGSLLSWRFDRGFSTQNPH